MTPQQEAREAAEVIFEDVVSCGCCDEELFAARKATEAAILATERRLAAQHAAEMARAVEDALRTARNQARRYRLFREPDAVVVAVPIWALDTGECETLSSIAPHGAQEPEAWKWDRSDHHPACDIWPGGIGHCTCSYDPKEPEA